MITAEDGRTGVQLAQETLPDLIICIESISDQRTNVQGAQSLAPLQVLPTN